MGKPIKISELRKDKYVEGLKKPGFRYDPANSRWIRDDRMADAAWENSTEVQPLSGPAYTVWPVMHSLLVEKKLKSISPQEALKLSQRGKAVLLDVRSAQDYERQHAVGAISCPTYVDVQGTGLLDQVKKVVMAVGLGMRATERNVNFASDAEKLVGKKNKKVMLMCSRGGSLETEVVRVTSVRTKRYKDPEKSFGLESRSLKAAYFLIQAGFKDVVFVDGGMSQWRYDGLDLE